MQIKIICDFRENFDSVLRDNEKQYNDHAREENAQEICSAFQELGYPCDIFGGVKELIQAINNDDAFDNILFINFSDGLTQNYSRVQVPILCEILNVPYSGSDPFASALMNNKYFSKMAVHDIGIKVPNGIIVLNNEEVCLDTLHYPLIIKPNTDGSSIGITQSSVVYNEKTAFEQIHRLFSDYEEVIVEEYIKGYELTNFIVGNKHNICMNEIIIYEMNHKLIQDKLVQDSFIKANDLRTSYLGEEILKLDLVKQIKEISEKIFYHIGARDVARIDYRVTEKGDIFFLEINSAPRISSTSDVGVICQKTNITFTQFIKKYLLSVLQRLNLNHDLK